MTALRRWQLSARAIFLLMLPLASVRAHGPLDNSAIITVGEDQLEVQVTLGLEAATRFFSEHLSGVSRPQPVGPGLSLPTTAADKLFSLVTSDGNVQPQEFRVLTDGLEFAFVARLPGTVAEALQFRAHYFDLNVQMPPGPLQVLTTSRQKLHETMLSRVRATAEFTLPHSREKSPGNASQSGLVVNDIKPATGLAEAAPTSPPTGRSNRFVGAMALALAAVLAVGFLLGRRRS